MSAFKKTIAEVVLLAALATFIGFTANAVRASGAIKWSKNYFDKGIPDPSDPEEKRSADRDDRAQDDASETKHIESIDGPKGPSANSKLVHQYDSVSFEDVVKIFNDPDTEFGLNVFIDARNQDAFADGHIPGAHQCFPFEIEKCIDRIMEHAAPADKVVVYCNGGDCEDSIFMCRELIAAGLSYDQVFLFDGGWKEWEDNDQPVEKGP